MRGTPPTGLVVRPCSVEHHAFIARLSEEAFLPYAADPSAEVSALIAEADATLVAIHHDAPVGFAVVRLARRERAYGPIAAPVIAHLDAIAVSRRLRLRGIGAKLLDEIEAAAARERAIAVFLRTAVANRPARCLFEAAGYRGVARYPHAYFPHQAGLVMMKPLPDR